MPPPPPPLPILSNPSISNTPERKTGRGNLMEEIRNNNVKLKHVETS